MIEEMMPSFWALGGAVAAFVIMTMVIFFRWRAQRRRNARRDRIITSVQEKWTDVDSILLSYRAGQISADDFRNALSEKLETINRTYKPGLHILDIFFVKYTEKLIEEYNRMIETGVIEVSQRETVSVRISPRHDVYPISGKNRKDETLVSRAKQAMDDSLEPPKNAAPEHVSEDAVVTAMAEASKGEEELPLETFLEMDTGAGVIGETPRTIETPVEKTEEAEPVEPVEETPTPQAKHVSSTIEAEYPEETMRTEQEAPFFLADKVSTGETPAVTESPAATADAEKDDDETMTEAAVSFQVRIPATALKTEPPNPVTPLRPPHMPAPDVSHEETIQQPATIYDIEAETIIADRNELLGVPKGAAPGPLAEKSQLGITGDDVSDMLDQFFGGKK
jgi:hypothetical protein